MDKVMTEVSLAFKILNERYRQITQALNAKIPEHVLGAYADVKRYEDRKEELKAMEAELKTEIERLYDLEVHGG